MAYEGETQIGFEIKAVNNLIRRKLDLTFSEGEFSELTGMQGPMIGYIHENNKVRDVFQKDIEKAFNIRRSTATVMLQTLEQKGYIVRQSVEQDARLKKILMTPKAEQYHMKIIEMIGKFNKELELGITAEEKEEFLRILDKVKDNLAIK